MKHKELFAMGFLRQILGFALLLGLLACAEQYPLDMPASQWYGLSTAQQEEARTMQAAIDRSQQTAPPPMAYDQALAVTAEERARKQAVAEAYKRGRYGDLVNCTLEGKSGPTPVTPLTVMLARQEIVPVTLRGPYAEPVASLWLAFDEAASQVSLCRQDPRKQGFGRCTHVETGFQRLEDGISSRILLPDTLQGVLSCRFTPGKGMPRYLSPQFRAKSH